MERDDGHSWNSGASVRSVSVSRSRNVGAEASRLDRFVLSKSFRSHDVTVAGIEACSKFRASCTTVPFDTQGDTRTAGTRTPSLSKLNGLPIFVSPGCATNPSSDGH